MPRTIETKILLRVIDANYNRMKEALRVCEDVCRFILNDTASTAQFKKIRHELTACLNTVKLKNLIQARDIENDVGKKTSKTELARTDAASIFYANIQRSKESMRVLEEFMKLVAVHNSIKLKNLRYRLYALEKKVTSKI